MMILIGLSLWILKMKYNKKIVRCNYCMRIFPRKEDVEYCFPGSRSHGPLCFHCNKGHLWLIDTEVNEERLKKDKYDREHPPLGTRISDGMHAKSEGYGPFKECGSDR